METLIDLHIHSNKSDGALSPKEIIDEATKNGLTTISIADHDTVEAYTDDLFKYAKEKNVQLIPAVEISTKTDKCGIHILGYNIDIKNTELQNKLYELRNARHDYLFNVSTKLNNLGYHINTEELDKIESVTKAHIALDIISNVNNKELLMRTFKHIPTKGEFIETIMNEGCPGYVKKASITPKEASLLIKQAGGKVILAHPVAYQYEDNLDEKQMLELIKDMNADGIESIYIYIDRNNNKINEITKWNNFAKDNNLIITIGSDFHNFDNIHPVIGLLNQDINLDTINLINIITKLIK